MMEQVGQGVVTHIRNGRAPSRSHVFGGGETWCGKKLVGEPGVLDCGTEVFNSYGSVVLASIDPASGSCRSCRSAFDAAYSEEFPDGPKPIATFHRDDPADMALAKAFFSPEGIQKLLQSASQGRCTMGVGCDETGVCYASAHGHPEMCPATATKGPTNER